MASTHYQQSAGRQIRHASITTSMRGEPDHTVRLTSRCDCAHNCAHAIAVAEAKQGWRAIVQIWTGSIVHAVETTVYEPGGEVNRTDIDDLAF